MKILLTGKDGQVGFALHKKLMSLGEVVATGRHELDLANPDAIKAFIDKTKPDIIINPAAYTKVDQAENEPELAFQINAIAPQVLSEKSSELDIPIIHFSTDYVFDGLKHEPYLETDEVNPQSVYGQTKWQGEEVVRQNKKHIIFRTSWVFSSHGQNFLKTILKLIQEKTWLNVVSDQIGTPTSSEALADVTYHIVKTIFNDSNFKDFGTYHMTLDNETNWYRYACFITDEAARLELQTLMTSKDIKPISSDTYPTLAKRPMNSRLDTTKIKKTFMLELPHWEEEVKRILKALTH
ncbi:RfbD dTDP-4-dehydrorhamnose reductase [Candidatus Methylopumilus planktonicus]|uniref:dTDP-4-dehydrorhamnose reductase n=1 Tax=Candidatus Methylopumilus planktonicus TaxID=1581557 RepID=UPI003BEF2431